MAMGRSAVTAAVSCSCLLAGLDMFCCRGGVDDSLGLVRNKKDFRVPYVTDSGTGKIAKRGGEDKIRSSSSGKKSMTVCGTLVNLVAGKAQSFVPGRHSRLHGAPHLTKALLSCMSFKSK